MDTTLSAPGPRPRRRRPGFFGFLNVVLSAVLCLVWLWIPLTLLIVGISGLFALGAGIIALIAWFFLQRGINAVERYRSEAIYRDGIPMPVYRRTDEGGFSGFVRNQWFVLGSGAFWRGFAHHTLKQLFGGVVGLLFLGALAVGLLLFSGAVNPTVLAWSGDSLSPLQRGGIGIAGVLIFACAWAVAWFSAYVDRLIDRSLLKVNQTRELTQKVDTLEGARSGAIEAATVERLRIERDLHDGVQPMLVALSMKLGMAKAKIAKDPAGAAELVTEAHADSKQAITELRQLARGIHPAVLSDRGLDAAVSALAAQSVVPTEVSVDTTGNAGQEAEAVAYFVIAEALTNITKHSGAHRARVSVTESAERLCVSVSDDGHGGARLSRGLGATGLVGLEGRVRAAGGSLTIVSPVGGPTNLYVEVPCAS